MQTIILIIVVAALFIGAPILVGKAIAAGAGD